MLSVFRSLCSRIMFCQRYLVQVVCHIGRVVGKYRQILRYPSAPCRPLLTTVFKKSVCLRFRLMCSGHRSSVLQVYWLAETQSVDTLNRSCQCVFRDGPVTGLRSLLLQNWRREWILPTTIHSNYFLGPHMPITSQEPIHYCNLAAMTMSCLRWLTRTSIH